MAWQWSVASRMARRSGGGVLSPVSLTSMLGIILGVTSLIVVLSITEGFESAFEDRILGFHPHVVVLDGPSRQFVTYREASEQIRSVSDVEEVSPSTFNEMLLAGKSGRVGVSVKGLPLTGLKNLLDSGVEWEGELNLLDATLGAELKDGEWSYTNPVAGTSWTVLHAEDQTPVVIRAPSARPAPGRAHVRVIQWDGSKGMWCTVDGDEVWVPAAQEGASRSVEVTPGSSRVRCGRW